MALLYTSHRARRVWALCNALITSQDYAEIQREPDTGIRPWGMAASWIVGQTSCPAG